MGLNGCGINLLLILSMHLLYGSSIVLERLTSLGQCLTLPVCTTRRLFPCTPKSKCRHRTCYIYLPMMVLSKRVWQMMLSAEVSNRSQWNASTTSLLLFMTPPWVCIYKFEVLNCFGELSIFHIESMARINIMSKQFSRDTGFLPRCDVFGFKCR